MQCSQNRSDFVCGLSTRKTVTPCSIQKAKTLTSSSHNERQAFDSKSNGNTSWYFFGGFSAYWIVPSGRVRNHSGCSLTYG